VIPAGEPLPEAAVLGILAVVQGITEFLPISSDGHLVLAQRALGLQSPGLGIDVALHLGTLVSVLVVYRRDLFRILREAAGGELRQVLLLALATLPVAVVGLLLKSQMESLFESVRAAALGLLGTAVILVIGEQARRRSDPARHPERAPPRESVTARDALLIGLVQTVAILPGVSRSGSTIATGLVVGLSPQASARFSFLLAVPAIMGAAVLEVPEALGATQGRGPWLVLAAAALAGVVGYGALRTVLAFLNRGAFAWFALYCAVVGLCVLALVG
jgi:undecaprenyl-diphosphatase